MIVQLRGYRLSLRPSEARRVFITPLGGSLLP
jgi:Fe2+ transport system protein FeoA